MSWQMQVVWVMVAIFVFGCLAALILAMPPRRAKVPRPQLPSKTDREIRQWDRFIKALREGEQR